MSKRSVVLLVLLLCLCISAFAAGEKNSLIKVYIDSKEDVRLLYSTSIEPVNITEEYIELVVLPQELVKVQQTGLKYEVVQDDLTAFYQSRFDATKDMGGYLTLSEIEDSLDQMIADHSNIVSTKVSLGQTIEGRDIWAVKISDNPNIDEEEPELLFTAAIHAREVITPLVLLEAMNFLTDNYRWDPQVDEWIEEREIWFILCCNPDGYYYNEYTDPGGGGMWRKNRRNNGDGTYGVDLNRNWGYEWGYDDEGSSPYTYDVTYRGTAPFSEPETQHLRDFHLAHEFITSVYFHSYSNLVLWPWGYDYLLTPDDDIFTLMGDSMATFNGYQATPAHGLYPANGVTDDWIYGEQTLKNKTFAFTFEVGSSADGFWPATSRIPELVEENQEPIKYLIDVCENIYAMYPPAQPELFVADTVDSVYYSIYWSHNDTLNPAVAYELTEMEDFQQITDYADDFGYWVNHFFSVSDLRDYSPPACFYSGNGHNANNYVRTQDPISVEAGDTLRFKTWYDIETDWDYAYVEVSTDGVTYVPIAGNITTNSNPHGNNDGNGITGSSGGWIDGLFDLSTYAGTQVYFRFAYRSDGYVAEEGFYVDDISPVEGFGSITLIGDDLTDTTYSFTNKPSGTYYYKVRAKDAEDQWGPFSALAETFVEGDSLVCVDSDGDGFGDPGHPENQCAEDNCPSIYNPDQADIDYDGFGDSCDNCPEVTNEGQEDVDSDGVGDLCDNCPNDYNPDQADVDDDGRGDVCDNCPEVANVTQEDADLDLVGDACDNCVNDQNNGQENADGDNYGDICDNCPTVPNDDQTNTDADTYGDACDNCPMIDNEAQTNSDADSYGDVCDNCPTVDNEAQTNSDSDSYGDACDNCPDDDNEDQTNSDSDTHGDVCDNCPNHDNEDQADSNSDGVGDACCCVGMRGNVDGDPEDACNVVDLTALVNYLFAGGAAPDCMEEANIDGDPEGTVNVVDLTQLVAYLFGGGEAPGQCP